MLDKKNSANLFSGFSKLSRQERLKLLHENHYLTDEFFEFFAQDNNNFLSTAEQLVENAIGYFQLPLGVAVNFRIDDHDYVIPMAIEETSVIAAASKTAKWIKENGKLETEVVGHLAIGQIQFAKVKNFTEFEKTIKHNKEDIINYGNRIIGKKMLDRGGGIKELTCRRIDRNDGYDMAVVHLLIDTCDAMGANVINQVCENLKYYLQDLTQEKVGMAILSNLSDGKLVRAKITLEKIDEVLAEQIAEASLFARLDPYRAATNNKGALNGMDGVLIATGNDWRAIAAGIHAYAARDGQYRSITQWTWKDGVLTGVLEVPIQIGIVGGVTQLHPMAKMSLQMLGIKKADDLARIIAAVGLVQNLGAIRALVTEGITPGHMKLHITNLCLMAGAEEHEHDKLVEKLQQFLQSNNRLTLSDACEILTQLRKNK